MRKFDVLIRGGDALLPGYKELVKINIAIAEGNIAAITEDEPDAENVIDATGLCVSPGFVDVHMHDEEAEDGYTVETALLRQGVTTAIAGNCGCGPLSADIAPKRTRPWLNLGYLTGHTILREKAGVSDIYEPAPPCAIERMRDLLIHEMKEERSFGVSFGLEYMPNASREEIEALLDVASGFKNTWAPFHIRHDGPKAVEAVDEVIGYARKYKMRFQISHTGSMCAFGKMDDILGRIDAARAEGLDVTFDCYPYDAFCTSIGSAVFDEGFEQRWGRGLEYLEVGSGEHKGQRLSRDNLYKRLRKEAPETLIIAHVMNGAEVEKCLLHPDCLVASDSLLSKGHGHPRVAGTFPRAIRMLLKKGVSLADALRKCTSLPAEAAFLDAGKTEVGARADMVIFDAAKICDRATFAEDLLPPSGIEWVIVGGNVAVCKNELIGGAHGKFMRRKR